jgi:N-methylhydantoinase A/oxoprolinase/acetone carboxylase beta subunit
VIFQFFPASAIDAVRASTTLPTSAIVDVRGAACCDAGAASIGVIRVDNMQQLHKAYEKVVRDLSRAKVKPCC